VGQLEGGDDLCADSNTGTVEAPLPSVQQPEQGELREIAPLRPTRSRTRRLIFLSFAGLVFTGFVVLLSVIAVPRLEHIRRGNERSLTRRSLAILPLHNSGQDSSSDFLGFSLADVLITKLSYVSSLSVRPSAAVERYRGATIDLQKVAADLKVDTLLTGSFIRDGDNLRVTYQLIDAKTERILGQGVIDLKYNNLLAVQDTVTNQLISELQLTLSPSEAERMKPENPVNPLAYEYFLQGLDFHGQHKFPLAIKMLEKSTEIDPNYAPAWAYLGASYNSDAAFELGGSEEYRRAQTAYERALAIRPNLLDAQIFLANLLVDTGKVEQAVPLLRDALKTNGNYSATHWELGYAYRFAGMLDQSVAECERARQLDPFVKANGSVLNTYLYLGQYQKFLESLPVDDSSFVLFYRGFGEFHEKHFDQASRDFDRAYELDPILYAGIGKALSDSIHQRRADGLDLLRELEGKIMQRGVGDPEATYKIAQAYAVLGDKFSALRVLRTSVDSGFFSYPYIAKDPLLIDLHSEPAFAQILNIAHQRYDAFRNSFVS
jgi:TolB-like protein/Flp pilus assembly protein TadD